MRRVARRAHRGPSAFAYSHCIVNGLRLILLFFGDTTARCNMPITRSHLSSSDRNRRRQEIDFRISMGHAARDRRVPTNPFSSFAVHQLRRDRNSTSSVRHSTESASICRPKSGRQGLTRKRCRRRAATTGEHAHSPPRPARHTAHRSMATIAKQMQCLFFFLRAILPSTQPEPRRQRRSASA